MPKTKFALTLDRYQRDVELPALRADRANTRTAAYELTLRGFNATEDKLKGLRRRRREDEPLSPSDATGAKAGWTRELIEEVVHWFDEQAIAEVKRTGNRDMGKWLTPLAAYLYEQHELTINDYYDALRNAYDAAFTKATKEYGVAIVRDVLGVRPNEDHFTVTYQPPHIRGLSFTLTVETKDRISKAAKSPRKVRK